MMAARAVSSSTFLRRAAAARVHSASPASSLLLPVVAGGGGRRGSLRAMSSTATPLTLWLLKYDYVPDILEKRTPHRGEHIAGLQQAATDGTLVLGGALADPVDTGILIFTQKEIAEKFAGQDPYVKAGLVTKWSVRQWTVVAGSKL